MRKTNRSRRDTPRSNRHSARPAGGVRGPSPAREEPGVTALPSPASGEPEVIRRLPSGVEYTFVKMIVYGAPIDPLTTLRLKSADHLSKLFRDRPYGKILAAIDAEEARVRSLTLVGEAGTGPALRQLATFRHFVYQSLLTEPALTKQGRSFLIRPIPTGFDDGPPPPPKARGLFPSWFAYFAFSPANRRIRKAPPDPGSPCYIDPHLLIQVWTLPSKKGQRPVLLGGQIVPPGDHSLEDFAEAVGKLLNAHCTPDELMRVRFRAPWRTRRGSPAWPVVTQYLVPALYDYLKPFYPVRRYTTGRATPGPGAFPRRLMDDIVDVLRMERPDLCRDLTPSQVLAAVKRYLAKVKVKRPMGTAMFRMGMPTMLPSGSKRRRSR